jgi:hypothetical protein
VAQLAADLENLSEATAALEGCKPTVGLPSVCWHGDVHAVNFLSVREETVAVDFGFSKFDEPPGEPYAMVTPDTLAQNAKNLDLLSRLDDVNPFFLAIYANMVDLGERLRVRMELEASVLFVDRLGPINPKALGKELDNIRMLVHSFNASRSERS